MRALIENDVRALIEIERHRVESLDQLRISCAALRQVTRELTDRKFGASCAVSDLMANNPNQKPSQGGQQGGASEGGGAVVYLIHTRAGSDIDT
jgi:hypothetical protein